MDIVKENNLNKIKKALDHAYNIRMINGLGIRSLEDRTQLSTEAVTEALNAGVLSGDIKLCPGRSQIYRLSKNPIMKNGKVSISKKSERDRKIEELLRNA